MNVNSIAKTENFFIRHIRRAASDSTYAAKALLLASVGLSAYSNTLDSIQIGKNKEIKKDEREYLSAFKLTEAGVSTAAQLAVGLTVLSKTVQGALRNGLSKLSPQLKETLKNPVSHTNLMKFSSLIAAVVLTKRVLVPFITTPLASIVKKHNKEKEEENIFETGKYKIDYNHDYA